MTIKERAANWIREVGSKQAKIDCKRAIERIEIRMDKYGFKPEDIRTLREHREILKEMQSQTP
jgi:hypothetical protein